MGGGSVCWSINSSDTHPYPSTQQFHLGYVPKRKTCFRSQKTHTRKLMAAVLIIPSPCEHYQILHRVSVLPMD